MELVICQGCGNILKTMTRSCENCNALVSSFGSTSLSEFSTLAQSLSIEIKPDPSVLERVLVKRLDTGNGTIDEQVDQVLSNLMGIASASGGAATPGGNGSSGNGGNGGNQAKYDGDPADYSQPYVLELPADNDSASESPSHVAANFNASMPLNMEVQASAGMNDNLVEPAPRIADSDYFPPVVPASAAIVPPPVESSSPLPTVAQELPLGEKLPEEEPKAPISKADEDFFFPVPPAPSSSTKADITENAPKSSVTSDAGLFDQPLLSKSAAPRYEQADESGDFQKKVAPPLGYQKTSSTSATNLPSTESSDSESEKSLLEDEEGEANKDELPKRRSFSGKQQPDIESAHASIGAGQEDSVGQMSGFFSREVDYLGFRVTRLMAISVTAAVVLVFFLAFQIFAGITSNILSGLSSNGSLGATGAHLSGRWQFAAQMPNRKVYGQMLLRQKGEQIFGEGKDDSGGYFQFEGAAKSNGEIDFDKQYMRGGEAAGRPIHFTGRVDLNQSPPFMQGEYSVSYRRGLGWHGESVTMTNIWEADLMEPGTQAGASASQPVKIAERHPLNLADLALRMAVGMIGLVVLVFVVLRTGFGPDGWRNRIAKEKYIPSQYLGPHRKELKELSQTLKPGGVPLGQRCEWRPYFPWQKKDLALTPAIRTVNPHILMLGSGDKGKSRLMAKMITHDIESNDRAVVLIDSDGSLADLIIHWAAAHPQAKELTKRVSVIDPSYLEGSLAYNPLEMPEDGDLPGAASALVYGFKAIYTEPPGSQSQWNAQTANILRNAAVLLMVNGRTLADLPTLLQDPDFRDVLLEGVEKRRKDRVEYGTIIDTWGQYKKLARGEQWITWVEPILNRITPMLSDPRIRPIMTKERGDINLRQVIKEKKVLIVKIPQGQLDQNANLLGGLIVTGLKQASLSVALNEKLLIRPAALYLDEFQNFIEKETFDAITSDTKKFQIGFVGASKSLQDLPEDFRNQLIINVGCIACFSLAKKDGDMLGPQMFRVDGRKKKHETLQNFINPFNTSHNFELISDEEKLNIDRVVGQAERTYFLYRVGTVAGVFHLKSHIFNDVPENHINQKLVRKMHGLKSDNNGQAA